MPRAAPLLGLATVALVGLAVAWGSDGHGGARGAEPLRLLPVAGSQASTPGVRIAATPVPTPTSSAGQGPPNGVWSTPAEFAPPE